VGSLHENTESVAPASAQVAFTLPSQPSSVPSLGEALVRLVTSIQMLEYDDPSGPNGSIVNVPGDEVGGPELVFDEALRWASETEHSTPHDVEAVATLDPISYSPSPREEAADTPADDGALLAAEWTLPVELKEDLEEVDRGETRLADLARGTVLATIVSIPLVLIERYRSAWCALAALTERDGMAKCTGESAEPRPGLKRPMRGRSRRPQRMKCLLWRRARTAKRGLLS
jgi:hypothetical protein